MYQISSGIIPIQTVYRWVGRKGAEFVGNKFTRSQTFNIIY